MKPLAVFNQPSLEYFLAPGMSKSKLNAFFDSPELYRWEQTGLIMRERTPAMMFGTRVHALSLEGRSEYCIAPETYTDKGEVKRWNWNSKVCKDWREKQLVPVVDKTEAIEIEQCAEFIRNDKHAAWLLKHGQAEVSVFGEINGRDFKGRVDWLDVEHRRIMDIKTISCAKEDFVSKEILSRNYHVQAYIYTQLCNAIWPSEFGFQFFFVFCQKPTPARPVPAINTRELDSSSIDLGGCVLRDALRKLADCEASNVWPGYGGTGEFPAKIGVPQWAHTAYANSLQLKEESYE